MKNNNIKKTEDTKRSSLADSETKVKAAEQNKNWQTLMSENYAIRFSKMLVLVMKGNSILVKFSNVLLDDDVDEGLGDPCHLHFKLTIQGKFFPKIKNNRLIDSTIHTNEVDGGISLIGTLYSDSSTHCCQNALISSCSC